MKKNIIRAKFSFNSSSKSIEVTINKNSVSYPSCYWHDGVELPQLKSRQVSGSFRWAALFVEHLLAWYDS